jgi:predicted dehydrogenase
MTRVALVGLGLIGRERLLAVEALREQGRQPVELAGVLDPDPERVAFARERAGAEVVAAPDLDALVALEPDWFVVATPHDIAVEVVPRLLATGAQVLVEKPLGRSLAEAEALAAAAAPGQLWVGLNYRFFAGVSALHADLHQGRFGRPISLGAVLGHGGAPGMEKSWKLDRVRAGGGALIDPGIHLLDLALLLAGEELDVRGGTTWSGFWGTGVEEDCHLVLAGNRLPAADLQISIVRWRSTFRLEVHGDEGYGVVEGRGRSYGPQRYRRGRRWGWQTAPSQAESEEEVLETSGDDVFTRELGALLFPGSVDGPEPCDARQALQGMRLLDACRARLGLASPAPRHIPTVIHATLESPE